MELAFTIIKCAVWLLFGVIPAFITYIVTKKRAKAKANDLSSDEELAIANDLLAAENDLLTVVNGFIAAAEETFAGFDKVMKTQNSSAGGVKKENVMTKLQAYALEKGYKIDLAYWSAKVDELVAFTKSVNAK